MLILLMAAYFFFMATETLLVDMSSRVSEIVEVCSNVLFDFLVVLAVMVAPTSALEGLPVVAVLVGETTLAGRRLDLGAADRRIELVEYEGL